jgi:uncharacterized protein YndB with AHSA1/START domain
MHIIRADQKKSRSRRRYHDRQLVCYVTYIATTPEKLWEALTSGEFTKKYYFGREIQSDWTEGSNVIFRNEKGEVTEQGTVLQSEPYRMLSFRFQMNFKEMRELWPKVTYELQPLGMTVKLMVKHEDLLEQDMNSITNGWPVILSGLKSLLETGSALQLG